MRHTILCNAEDLLGLIEKICSFRWDQKGYTKDMPHFFGGIPSLPIYCDGKPLEETEKDMQIRMQIRVPDIMQRFNQFLDDIYTGKLQEAAICQLESEKWKKAAHIIFLGKRGGLSRADWGEALSHKR